MFAFHEKTQRRIGLAGFGLLCAVPTAAVLVWIVSLYLPSHRRGVERSFSHLLGMEVRVQAVRYPKPGVAALEDVEIRTAESGEVILRAKGADVYSRWDGTTVINAARVSVDAKHYPAVEELFRRLLTRRVKPDTFQVRVNVGELSVRMGESKRTILCDVRGVLSSEPEESQTHWNCQVADSTSGEPIRLSFRRRRDEGPVSTVIGVDTGETDVSSELLGLGLPWMRMFGAATFCGRVNTESHGGGTETQLHGRWCGLEVESLVEEGDAAGISGLADLNVSYARFHNGRLSQVTGVLSVGPGSVQQRFLQTVGLSYDLEWNPGGGDEKTPIAFSWLEADFRLENGMLALRTRNEDSGGVLMQGAHGEALLRTRPETVPPDGRRFPGVPLDAFRFPGLRIPVVEVDTAGRWR